MGRQNNESFQIAVRVKNTPEVPHYVYLESKAVANPENKSNSVGTEINTLIARDYEKSLKAKKRK